MATPPEVEATLARLHSHRNVKGLLILSSETGKVIRYSGAMLEEGAASGTASAGNGNGDDTISNGARREASSDSASAVPEPAAVAGGASGSSAGPSIHPTVKRYADAVRRIVENSRLGVEELDDQDRVKFLRIRTKKYEMMITPEDKYTLVVFHEPSSA